MPFEPTGSRMARNIYPTGSRVARNAYSTGSHVARSALRAPVSAAPSQPLQITNGFEQPPKPGGLEITNGFEPANPAPGALQITNGFDTPTAPPATGAGVQSAASALGVPPDAAAQMARGFPMPGGMQPQPESFANGGMVRGPGTGTSDSVKDAVSPGTYIMPADSTRQIGEQNMAGLGFRPGMMQAARAADPGPRLGFKPKVQREKEGAVQVNLSNGEYKVPPEQVQAIGAQVLDAMKGGTHTPTGQGEEVGEDKPASPSLYFADGGEVEGPKKRSMATSPTNTYPGNQAEAAGNIYAKSNADMAQAAGDAAGSVARGFPGTATALRGAGQAIQDAYKTGGVGAAIGQGVRGAMVPAVGLADDVMGSAARVLNPAAQALKTFVTGDASPIGQESEPPARAASAPPATAPKAAEVAPAPADGQDAARGFRPGMGAPADAPPASPEPGAGLGFRPGMGNSSPDVMGILQRESKIRGEMSGLRDQIAFNEGGSGFRKTTNDEIVRDMLVNGGAGDRSAALGFMAGRQDAGARQDMSQQELALRKEDAQSRQGIAAGEFGLKQEAQGFQSAAQRRIQGLQDQYQAETDPAKRNAIAQQLRDLGGKQDNRFTVVPGGEEWDSASNTMRKVPSRVLNNQTGQFVDQPQAGSAARPAPSAGTVMNGYRFKGGNPADKNSWEKV